MIVLCLKSGTELFCGENPRWRVERQRERDGELRTFILSFVETCSLKFDMCYLSNTMFQSFKEMCNFKAWPSKKKFEYLLIM